MTVPEDFVPENSDVMSPEEEYELIKILGEIEEEEGIDLEGNFVDAPRPGGTEG
jgi:hypothetical protein